MTAIWDDPEVAGSDDFYDFENVGDKAYGRIKFIGKHTWPDGKVVPQLILTDDTTGTDRTLTAKQVQLKAKLVELRPGVGDHIGVNFTGIEKRDGGTKTLKLFTVEVNKGGGAATPAPQPVAEVAAPAPVAATVAAPAPVAATVADPAAAQAAIEAMDPATRQLLGL